MTLSPRQRIVVRREVARRGGDPAVEADWPWDGLDTCAGDGLCAAACPVEIDTGALVRDLRAAARPPWARALASLAVARLGAVERGARAALALADAAADVLGPGAVEALSSLASRASGRRLPAWSAGLPRAGRPPRDPGAPAPDLVYFASCTGRVLGAPRGTRAPTDAFLRVAARAGVGVRAPALPGRCCGLPFQAKGFPEAGAAALARLVADLHRASDGGRLPVVVDASSCAQALRGAGALLAREDDRARWRALRVRHPAEALREWLPRLRPRRLERRVALHPTCGARRLGVEGALLDVTRACADVRVPATLACCGSAGDRGLLAPELPRSALAHERAELARGGFDGLVADNPACEAGLRAATGLPFRSFVHLVEEATRPGAAPRRPPPAS
ncbi:MAG: (Fe-S)-binding protein [Planctomycetes bacterium]|nr:(Fe-S)-binding protein [Planctomycetota bacterium]